MAPKKTPAIVPESSSSEDATALPIFILGVGVRDFATFFDGWVERFTAGQVDFQFCKDLISFVNDYYVLGPGYVDQKFDQLWNYEFHPIRASIPVFRAEGVDWSNWNKMLPKFFPKIDVSSVDLRWVDWMAKMEPRYTNYWLDNGIYQAITCSTIQL